MNALVFEARKTDGPVPPERLCREALAALVIELPGLLEAGLLADARIYDQVPSTPIDVSHPRSMERRRTNSSGPEPNSDSPTFVRPAVWASLQK